MTSGRKREFCENAALNAAMEVFWQKGYVGASLSDLTKSMGINKPSMYSAFGNKEALFIKAVEHYIETKMSVHFSFLQDETVPLLQRIKNYMMSIVCLQCQTDQPKGCFLALCISEVAGGDMPEEAAALLCKVDLLPKKVLTELLENDSEAIALGLNKSAQTNALSLYTMLKGTAAMARSGLCSKELEYAIDNIIKGISAN